MSKRQKLVSEVQWLEIRTLCCLLRNTRYFCLQANNVDVRVTCFNILILLFGLFATGSNEFGFRARGRRDGCCYCPAVAQVTVRPVKVCLSVIKLLWLLRCAVTAEWIQLLLLLLLLFHRAFWFTKFNSHQPMHFLIQRCISLLSQH